MLGSFDASRNSAAFYCRGTVHTSQAGKRCTSYAALIRIGGLDAGCSNPFYNRCVRKPFQCPAGALRHESGELMSRVKITMPDQFLFSLQRAVGISDLNYARHLDSVSMVKIVHEARLQFLAHLGLTEANIFGLGMVVTDLAVDYQAESFANDLLCVEVGVGRFNRYGCDIVYQITNTAWERVVCSAQTGIVFFDFDKHKIALIPKAFSELLKKLESAAV